MRGRTFIIRSIWENVARGWILSFLYVRKIFERFQHLSHVCRVSLSKVVFIYLGSGGGGGGGWRMVSWGIVKVVKERERENSFLCPNVPLLFSLCSVSFFVILVNGHLAFLLASCSILSSPIHPHYFSTQGRHVCSGERINVKSNIYRLSRKKSRMSRNSHLIFLNFFFDSGLLCDPLHVSPSIPVTKVASSPLSDGLHSNSTSSSSPKLRNPSIWMADCREREREKSKKKVKSVLLWKQFQSIKS